MRDRHERCAQDRAATAETDGDIGTEVVVPMRREADLNVDRVRRCHWRPTLPRRQAHGTKDNRPVDHAEVESRTRRVVGGGDGHRSTRETGEEQRVHLDVGGRASRQHTRCVSADRECPDVEPSREDQRQVQVPGHVERLAAEEGQVVRVNVHHIPELAERGPAALVCDRAANIDIHHAGIGKRWWRRRRRGGRPRLRRIDAGRQRRKQEHNAMPACRAHYST